MANENYMPETPETKGHAEEGNIKNRWVTLGTGLGVAVAILTIGTAVYASGEGNAAKKADIAALSAKFDAGIRAEDASIATVKATDDERYTDVKDTLVEHGKIMMKMNAKIDSGNEKLDQLIGRESR